MSGPESDESTISSIRMTQSHMMRGYMMAAGAAIMWGVSGVITKYLLNHKLKPEELLVFRTTMAAGILFAWLGLTSPDLLRVRLKDLPYFALLGAIGLVANQGFYYLALTMVSVGYALLLQYMAPVFLMVYGVLSKTERMTGGKAIAAVMAIGGCAAMVLGQAGGIARVSFGGSLAALGSAVGFAFYTGYGKYGLRKYDPRTMMAYAFLFAGLMWIMIRPLWTLPWSTYTSSNWLLFIYLSTVATVIPFWLFLTSLRYLEPSRSSLTSMLEPVVAATIAWLWLGESMTFIQALGGAAVLAGVILLQIERVLISRFLIRDMEKGSTQLPQG